MPDKNRQRTIDRLEEQRAQIQLVDIFMSFFVLVAILVLAPFFTEAIDMMLGDADPFTSMVIRLVLPLLLLSLIVSIGVSARRRGG